MGTVIFCRRLIVVATSIPPSEKANALFDQKRAREPRWVSFRSASSHLSGPSDPAGIGTFPLVRTNDSVPSSARCPYGHGVVAGLHRASPSASLDKKTPIEFSVIIRQSDGECQPVNGAGKGQTFETRRPHPPRTKRSN